MTTPPPGDGRRPGQRDYSRVQLDDAQIASGRYKDFLGGKAAGWDARGAFQPALLQHLGLRRDDALLDIGCGPIRGGVHFIRFLDAGRYTGVDFNPSFVTAAQRLVAADPALSAREPRIALLPDFEFATLGRRFDRLLCFSVLNHCDERARDRFFARVPDAMHAGSRLLVTHAAWLDEGRPAARALRVTRRIDAEAQLPPALAFSAWGFDGVRDRLPMLEFALA